MTIMIPPDSPIEWALLIEEVIPEVEATQDGDPDDPETCEFCGEPLVDDDCDVCGRSL